MYLATGEQMQAIDQKAINGYGIPGQLLMEAASSFTAQVATNFLAPGDEVLVVTGAGNNGGDGWGAARHLASKGYLVRVLTAVDPEGLKGDAALQFRIYRDFGLTWERYLGPEQIGIPHLIMDALLGTGVKGAPRDTFAGIIQAINNSSAPVLAVDIPSGLPADSSPPQGAVVKADATVSFGLGKVGLYTGEGRQVCGEIYIDSIGLPHELLTSTGIFLNTQELAKKGLPLRKPNSHKGTYGHGLLVAGSRGMSGAAMLAAKSALRTGIGLLTVACPQEINPVLEANLLEAMTKPMAQSPQGTFSGEGNLELEKHSAAAVGPGCRVSVGTKKLVQQLVDSNLPLVIDADGLNSLAPGIPKRAANTIVSPHPGEMARLLGNTIGDVSADPMARAVEAAKKWGCTVILKGVTSFIAGPGGKVAVNITGTDGLATGGSGDVLTGLLLGLLTQGAEPFLAACTATWLLGRASELAAEELGTASQLPGDVVNSIPQAITDLNSTKIARGIFSVEK